MKPYYSDDSVTLWHGDCLEVLRSLPDSSVDSVVTDPPYGLEFMGKDWDGANGFRRSLNPADTGRDNAFGRTSAKAPEYNTGRGVRVAAEWKSELTATGKGHTTSVGPYLASGVDSIRVAGRPFQDWCEEWSRECLRVLKPGGHMLAFGGSRTWHRLASAVEDAGFEIRDSIAWLYGSGFPKSLNLTDENGDRTGWGTALKPAFEPIVVGRKPLAGTVAANVFAHRTGAINVDGCRVGVASGLQRPERRGKGDTGGWAGYEQEPGRYGTPDGAGRWPTNVILDGSQAAKLDAETGVRSSGANPTRRGVDGSREVFGDFAGQEDCVPARGADSGGASRFFPTFHYEPKAGTTERPRDGDTAHPTVKPLDLMRWLVRLVTPPGGTVLEPFAGSGTTAEACVVEGFKCIAIERDETYLPLIVQRLTKPIQVGLDFGGVA